MNITAGAIVVIVILILVGFCFFFNSKIGKRVRIRASGTANEAIQKDAATPEGAKAYYNAAIEKKEDELQQENVRYQQMLGKISNYEDDLFHLKKDAMKADVNVNACVDRGDDEAAKVYLKEQQELNDKIDFIKNTLKEWKENADVQKEKVEVLQQQLNDLKAEKESVNSKNKELLAELKTARNKNKEIDADAYYKTLDELETIKSENSKLLGTIKQKDIEVQKLSTSFQEANGKLEQLSYDDAITKVVDGLKLAGNKQAIAKKLLKAEATFKDGSLSFGDKSVDDFVKDWTSPTGEGYMFLEGTQHSGGGASGGGNPPPNDQPKTRTEAYAEMFK